ncbi:MAG TPA: hypothetical protein VFQ44_30965 [Streptosporangiaceae bacterium]|nr:hypothetical protein [Streptosporangiaceae bacterium]
MTSLLPAHLRRLQLGLSDARAEFSTVLAFLENRQTLMTSFRTAAIALTVSAPALAAALDSVRFAASTDPELPVLGGVLFDIEGDQFHFVATDRYRLALARAAATGYGGPRVQAIVPAPLADAMRALLTGDAPVRLALDGDRVALDAGDRQAAGRCLHHDYPDYRRILALPEGRRVPVSVPELGRRRSEASPAAWSRCSGRTGGSLISSFPKTWWTGRRLPGGPLRRRAGRIGCQRAGSLQLAFCDLGTPRPGWNAYAELKHQPSQTGMIKRWPFRVQHA